MSFTPFPTLGPSERRPVEPVAEITPFPSAGVIERPREEWPYHGMTAVWARPRPESVHAVRPRVPLGLAVVDEFLGGGLPAGSTLTVTGPPFGGKRSLACHFLAASVGAGAPTLALLTDGDVSQWRHAVATMTARVPEERRGLACFLDLHGPASARPGSEPVPLTDQVLNSVANACESLPSDRRRFVFDSFSTVSALCGFPSALSMLMRLTALLRREGATTLVLVEADAHSPLELQMVKRQSDGAIDFRVDGGLPELQLAGLGLLSPSPWLQGRGETGSVQVPPRGA